MEFARRTRRSQSLNTRKMLFTSRTVCFTFSSTRKTWLNSALSLVKRKFYQTVNVRKMSRYSLTCMSFIPEPAMLSCDTGQRKPFFNSCQLITKWMPITKFYTDSIKVCHFASANIMGWTYGRFSQNQNFLEA